jgi:hypothetical protein
MIGNSDIIKEFLVGLGFQVDDTGMSKFQAGLQNVTVKAMAVGAAVAAAAVGVVHYVDQVADKYDSVSDLGARVNASATDLMRMQYVANLTDSSVEAVASSMDNLNRVIGEAALGIGRGKMTFEKLGMSARKANGDVKSTSEVMDELSRKLATMSKPEQMATIEKLGLDRTMIGMLTGDVAGLKAEFDELFKGFGIDAEKAAAAGSDFKDAIFKITYAFGMMGDAVALKLMPRVQQGMEELRSAFMKFAPQAVKMLTPVFDWVMKIAGAIIKLSGRVLQGGMVIVGWLQKLDEATGGWSTKILAAVVAWKYLNLAFLASPLGLILSLGVAVLALVDDFLTWQEGGDSLIDWGSGMGQTLLWLTGIITGVGAAVGVVKVAMAAWAVITKVMAGVSAAMTAAQWLLNVALAANPIGLVIIAIGALIAAGALLVANWDKVKSWFSSFFAWLKSGFDKLAEWATKAASFVEVGSAQKKQEGQGLTQPGAKPLTFPGLSRGGKMSAAPLAPTGAKPLTFPGLSRVGKMSAAPLAPTGSRAVALAGAGGGTVSQSLKSDTTINVYGNSDPAATGRAVAGQQKAVSANLARNMKGAAR